MHSFEHTPAEARALLARSIKDLGLRIEGSPLEKHVAQLHRELREAGLPRFQPRCYLSDEWACPDGEPIIGIPFYLADPHLAALEASMNDVEEEREILMFLRHEAGHALNYAFKLHERPEWVELFGAYDRPYLDDYKSVPFSRRFVRHIAGWYAQKHPDEDFAETFAVWLTPGSDWRRRYAGWPALKKLEYVDQIARELAQRDPPRPLADAVAELPVEEMKATVEEFYKASTRDEELELAALAGQRDLEDIFAPAGAEGQPAAALLQQHRRGLVDKVTYWTGVRRSLVKALVDAVAKKAREHELTVPRGKEAATLVELSAYCTVLVMTYLAHGRFVEG